MVLIGTMTTVAVAAIVEPVPEEIKAQIPPVFTLPDPSQLFPYPPELTLPNTYYVDVPSDMHIWPWFTVYNPQQPIYRMPIIGRHFPWIPIYKPITLPITVPIQPPITVPIPPPQWHITEGMETGISEQISGPVQLPDPAPLTIIGSSVQQSIASGPIYQSPVIGGPIEMPIVVPLEGN